MIKIEEDILKIVDSIQPKVSDVVECSQKIKLDELNEVRNSFFEPVAQSFVAMYEQALKMGNEKKILTDIVCLQFFVMRSVIKKALLVYMKEAGKLIEGSNQILNVFNEETKKIGANLEELKRDFEKIQLLQAGKKKDEEFVSYLLYAGDRWGNQEEKDVIQKLVSKIKK